MMKLGAIPAKVGKARLPDTKNINGQKKPFVEFYFDLFGQFLKTGVCLCYNRISRI